MSTLSMAPGIAPKAAVSAADLFAMRVRRISRRTDKLFAALLTFQWIAAMVTADLRSPRTWAGESSRVHPHVWAALLLGGAIISLPVALALFRAGATSTRHAIAAAQALMGALLIHIMDGRIEMHFHVFGSLALLAFYRDWRVLVTASAFIAVDHLVRGLYWPQSVFGVRVASSWRWAEHTAWVVFEDIFLIRSCVQNVGEMRDIAEREAALSRANEGLSREVAERKRAEGALLRAQDELEARVSERTAALSRANEGLSREVAERKRAEGAQRRMVAILEATTDFVGMADADGRLLYVNAAGLRMVGMREEDVPKTCVSDCYADSAGEVIAREAMPTASRDGVWSGEVAMRHRDGHEIPVSVVHVSHRDAHGNVEFFSTIARDIADGKRKEQEIQLLNSQLERRLNRLNALHQVDIAITRSFDLGVTLSTLLDQVSSQLGVDAADVLLLDPRTGTLRHVAGRGFRSDAMQQSHLNLERSVPGRVASEGIPLHLPDIAAAGCQFVRAKAIEEEGFVAYSSVPLISQGMVKGVLETFHRAPLEMDQEGRDFLEVLAGQAAIAIDSARLFEDLQRSNAELTLAYDATIEGWSRALDLRDKETEGHTRRVTEMTVRLARAMGLDGADLIDVRRGALLHDIGKLGVPDSILLKPGKLTAEEWALMRRHPTYAYEWLSPIAFLRPALDIPYCHHEKMDGTGYPRGLEGEQIPLAARIFAVVDIWDALRSDRPYRAGLPEQEVVEHIRSLSGSHLDPAVVDAFQRCLAADPFESAAFAPEYATPEAAVEAPGDAEFRPGRDGSTHPEPSGLTILVAEDHPHSARVLRRMLEGMGHHVRLAVGGEEAWEIVRRDRPRVVIADWMMPGLDGLELCRRIREGAWRPYTYILLVSGRDGMQDRMEALDAGADDFLAKPLDPPQLAVRLEVARRIFDANRDLELRNATLEELATTDDLTGLKNRRHFREVLDAAFSLAARQGLPLSLIMLDVDHFKSFNDEFGHQAGDDVLRTMGAILRDQARPYDLLARHGGEEFVLLLPATDGTGAMAVAERMRIAIAGHRWPERRITASFGVATIPPARLGAPDLVDAADQALYKSKARGRNLVTLAVHPAEARAARVVLSL